MTKAKAIFEVKKLRIEREAVILHEVGWRVEHGQHWVILGAPVGVLRAASRYRLEVGRHRGSFAR
jgi:hypothetical protein